MKRIDPYLALFGVVIAGLLVTGLLTLTGGRVSQVFSTINSGLTPGGGGGSAALPPPPKNPLPPAPVAQPRPAGNAPSGQQQAAIKAGEIDDNDRPEDYLRYLDTYQGPPAQALDVSERYLIAVRDDQQRPLLDARVRIYEDQRQVFEGRTYAGGKTLFLPSGAGPLAEHHPAAGGGRAGQHQRRGYDQPWLAPADRAGAARRAAAGRAAA